MFVATTLAISLALSPVTTLGMRSTPRAYAWMAAPAEGPAAAPAPGPALAGPAPAGAPNAGCPKLEFRAALQMDTTALSDDAQGVASRLRTKAEQEITRFDVMLGADPAGLPVVVIKLVPLTGEDEGFSYTIDINHLDHTPIKDGSSVGECKLCTESELLEKVAGSTRALMPKLRAYITDFNNQPCAPALCKADVDCKGSPDAPVCHVPSGKCVKAPSKGECNSDADCLGNVHGAVCHKVTRMCVGGTDKPPPDGMNGKQKAGIGLMVAGALGVGVGIGLVVRKPQPVAMDMAWQTRETQKPGFAVLAVGGAALVTGIVLFVLGRRQQTRTNVGPVAGGGTYGLVWSGRF
jgi:hypothetical protein